MSKLSEKPKKRRGVIRKETLRRDRQREGIPQRGGSGGSHYWKTWSARLFFFKGRLRASKQLNLSAWWVKAPSWGSKIFVSQTVLGLKIIESQSQSCNSQGIGVITRALALFAPVCLCQLRDELQCSAHATISSSVLTPADAHVQGISVVQRQRDKGVENLFLVSSSHESIRWIKITLMTELTSLSN